MKIERAEVIMLDAAKEPTTERILINDPVALRDFLGLLAEIGTSFPGVVAGEILEEVNRIELEHWKLLSGEVVETSDWSPSYVGGAWNESRAKAAAEAWIDYEVAGGTVVEALKDIELEEEIQESFYNPVPPSTKLTFDQLLDDLRDAFETGLEWEYLEHRLWMVRTWMELQYGSGSHPTYGAAP